MIISTKKLHNPIVSVIVTTYNRQEYLSETILSILNQTFQDFELLIIDDGSTNDSQNLILDLRFNAGGDGSIFPPMLKTLIEFEIINPEGNIFVLMGRGTFSAAQNLLTEITKFTNAILVGEPSGSKPSFIGEAGWFKLPYSGWIGIVASQYHQTYKAG